ncbi:MAG: arabinofuranosidase catalytic domain-containing protein [Fibrobacteraceae bacterium]
MKELNQLILFVASISLPALATNAATGPCDIYADAKTPCVAAHSTVRALFGNYTGNLYQVRRADGTTKDIPVEKAGGYAKISTQDDFCNGTTCTISILYDQTSYHNDLVKSPVVYWLKNGGKEADASAAQIVANGHKVHGIYRTSYSTIAYRNNATKGVATGDEAESMYMVVDGKHYNDLCCFDYGNAETTGNDDGPGTMESVYFGDDVLWGGYGQGDGPWVAADLEDGVFKGNDAGWNWGKTNTTPWPTAYSFVADFVTAMLKGPSDGTFQLKGADAQKDSLTTVWDGARKTGYSPRKLQGAIILGCGGDGSDGGAGTFFEGVMTIGNPPDSIDKKIQANIAAAGYGSTVDLSDTVPISPYKDTLSIPGKIEAEDYDNGGNGRGFYDTDIANETDLYREDNAGIDSANGAYVYGWVTEGDWLRYTINVTEANEISFVARVASASDNAAFSLYIDDGQVASVTVPNTGDWKTFEEVTGKTNALSIGTHTLKLKVDKAYFNIDWIDFKTSGIEKITPNVLIHKTAKNYVVYNLKGIKISTGTDWDKISKGIPSGVYLLRNLKTGKIQQVTNINKRQHD